MSVTWKIEGRALGVALVVPPLLGCTWEPGHGFATLETLRLRTALEVGAARDLDGAVLTDLGYVVRLSELTLELQDVEFMALDASDAVSTFDPASPPAGYSLCHGGHCHKDDGSLVDTIDVQAELAGTTARWTTIATLPVQRSVNVLNGKALTLTRVEPSRELPAALINKLTLSSAGVVVRGSVERTVADGGSAFEPVAFNFTFNVGPTLSAEIELDVSRDGPALLRPQLSATLDGALFDGIDFGALAQDGALTLTDADHPAAIRLLAALANAELEMRKP